MAHALNNASHGSAASELGIAVGTNRLQTSLTRHATINAFSFYRPGSIAPSGTYDITTLTAPSNNDKLGDFRGYNHSAQEPYPFDVYPTGKNWGPGGTTMSLTFQIYTNEWNLDEVTGGSTPYITIRYYLTSKTRTAGNGTGGSRTYTAAVTMTSNTPPTGHTNNQTTKQASGSQLVTDASFPTSLLTTPDDILYCDLYISDASGNQVARFGTVQSDGYVNISTHEQQAPLIYISGLAPTPWPTGVTYTAIYPVISTSNGACNDDSPLAGGTIGTNPITFYFGLHGQRSGTKSIGATSVTIRITYDGGTRDVVLGTVVHNSKTQVVSTLPTGKTWAYDKDVYISCIAATFASTPTETSC